MMKQTFFCHRCGKNHTPTCTGECGLQVHTGPANNPSIHTCDKRSGHVKRGDLVHVDWDTRLGTDAEIAALSQVT